MADYNSIYTGPQIDSAVGLALTSIQPSVISSFETTSQLNDRDSDNRNRANHVGTQTASTISNFDSAVNALIGGLGALDSDSVLGLIDSAYVQSKQDYSYSSLVGAPNVLDSSDVSLIASSLSGIDSSAAISLIDSAYVQARQDFTYGSLTGTPNVLDSSDVSLIASGLGSTTFADLTEIDTADLDVHDIGRQAATTLVVTANGSSAYRFDQYGTADNPTIYAKAGTTIAFDLTAVSSHPFQIQTTGASAYSTGLVHVAPNGTVSTGASAQGKTSGTVYWKVPASISGTYEYVCTSHGGMNGDVEIEAAAGVVGGLDSSGVTSLVDSAYVQLRQDFAYGSLTGTPNVLDSADVSFIASGFSGIDSSGVTGLIDSAYVQTRQDFAYSSLIGTPNILDSADVSLIAGDAAGLDSSNVIGLIDSAYVQSRQDFAYGSLTGTPNVLDSADVSLIASGLGGIDSSDVIGLIDSAYVQTRQDFAYGSLTGAPTALSAFTNDTLYLDSATATQLIDSAYIQLRQLTAAPTGVDSAYVTSQINALIDGAPGALDTLNEIAIALNNDSDAFNTLLSKIDSNGTSLASKLDATQSLSLIATTVDSAYVQARQLAVGSGGIDSAASITLITSTVDSAYVQARQDFTYASLTGAPNVLDSADVVSIAGASGVDSASVTAIVTSTVDSAYVQARQDFAYGSLTGAPNVLDSADVTLIAGASGIDSAATVTLITSTVDSAYVQARQDFAYSSLTGTPNVLDSADVVLIAGASGSGLDSASATQLIDSAYVQLRQDFAYASLTGAPTALSAFTNDTLYLDSVTATQLIDSAYIQLRQSSSGSSTFADLTEINTADLDVHDIGRQASTTLVVTANGFSAYRFDQYGTVDNPTVYAKAGTTIGFDLTAVSGHPFQIQTSGGSTNLVGLVHVETDGTVTTESSAQGKNSGTLYWKIPALVSDTYEYICQFHGGMNGAIAIEAAAGGGGLDSGEITSLLDSAYVQARQDFAYASLTGAPTVLSAFTNDTLYLDSATATQLIDSAYIQLRQSSVGTGGVDSAYVTSQINALIDGAPGALDTLNELAAAINDDSQAYDTLLSLINTKIDSADALTLITTTVDSAYVQLRQNFAYSSLTGAPNVLDSADVALIAGASGSGLDSALATSLITTTVDSAYVQLRQDFAYSSLTGTPNILDSAETDTLITARIQVLDIADIVGATGNPGDYLASLGNGNAEWENISVTVDSAYVQARQLTVGSGVDSSATISLITSTVDSAYVELRADTLITARIQVLDIADIIGATGNPGEYLKSLGNGNAEWENISVTVDSAYVQARQLTVGSGGIDSATAITLITTTVDSAYVQLRQDFSYASLTGAPNVLDSADVALIAGSGGVDSAATTSIITTTVDSAYVQFRQDYSYASLTGTPNVLDSADVALIAGGGGGGVGGGLDSSETISLINTTVDSAYVQTRITSSAIYSRTITTATAGQTVFAATYVPNYVDVFINGIKILDTTDFVATNGTSVTLNSASEVGDVVEITAWVPTAIVGSVSAWVTVDSSLTLYSGQKALVDTSSSAVTLTLPSTPNLGDEVRIIDATDNAAINNITVARNGSNIMGLSENFTVNINEAAFGLVYFNASRGWVLTEK